jgi:hypothetical protein
MQLTALVSAAPHYHRHARPALPVVEITGPFLVAAAIIWAVGFWFFNLRMRGSPFVEAESRATPCEEHAPPDKWQGRHAKKRWSEMALAERNAADHRKAAKAVARWKKRACCDGVPGRETTGRRPAAPGTPRAAAQKGASERQGHSVQPWNCPTQAKRGLEWATRPHPQHGCVAIRRG